MSSQLSAQAITAQTAITRMSIRRWSILPWQRGSSTTLKCRTRPSMDMILSSPARGHVIIHQARASDRNFMRLPWGDLRVRWALHEAALPYETKLIGVEERTSAVHRKRHPFGMVPVFEADGRQLVESGAIVYAIAKQSSALMPEDEAGRDQTLAWMFAALNTVDVPVQNLFDVDVLHPAETWAQLRRPDAVKAVEVRLSELADALGERDYLLGRFTAADILMVTVLRFLRHTDLV